MAEKWSAGPDLERDLLYAGSAAVRIPAECVQEENGFAVVPSRASAGGFVVVDIRAGDTAACPGEPGVLAWTIFRDRSYRVMRTGSRNGRVREEQDGPGIDEAWFSGEDVLAVYRAAASDPDPDELLARAFGVEYEKPVPDDGTRCRIPVPADLVLSGGAGCGVVFPDPEAMGGIGLVGGPEAAYAGGKLDLGGWCGHAWRLVSRTLVPVPAAMAAEAVRSALSVWEQADAKRRERFLFMKPEALPPWPEFHGRDVVVRNVPVKWTSGTDLPGTVQVALPDGTGMLRFALLPEASVLASGNTAAVYLGRSDMPVTVRGMDGTVSVMSADRLAKTVRIQERDEGPKESVMVCGISRMDVDTDYSDGMSDVSFMGPDGSLYGFRVPMEALQEGDDGYLAVSLGDPEAPVRFYRRADDGIREGAPMTAAGLAELIDLAGAAGRRERKVGG